MTCPTRLDDAVLADYWTGEAPPSEALEEHLLACAECAGRLESLVVLMDGIRALVRQGALSVLLTPRFLERLTAEGVRVRQYAPPAGGSVQCTITSHDDVLVGCLAADLTGVERLDAVLRNPDGSLRARFPDIPFRAEPTELVLNQPAHEARRFGHEVLIVQLVSPGPHGDRIVAEYTFNHSPSPL